MKKLLFLLFGLIVFNVYSQVTITEEEFNKLPKEVQTQLRPDSVDVVIEKLEKTSKAVSIGKEIGTAVNETLNAVSDNVIKIADSRAGRIAIGITIWKLVGKDIAGLVVGLILLGFCIYFIFQAKKKLSADGEDGGGFVAVVASIIFFGASMICIFG